jgi:transcriptional regulator GlxA family with amidase domain
MQIAIVLYPEVTALDAIGPYAVLSRLPGVDLRFVAPERGIVRSDSGVLAMSVEHTLDETLTPDVIVVPGGLIARTMMQGHPVVDWIRAVHPTTTWTTSVCTGSLLLGAAGVLTGLDATSHWRALELLERFGARPTLERVVDRGKVITSAGVSSGIDMALVLVDRLAGRTVAEAIQLAIEYDPQPPFDSGSPLKASEEVKALVAGIVMGVGSGSGRR